MKEKRIRVNRRHAPFGARPKLNLTGKSFTTEVLKGSDLLPKAPNKELEERRQAFQEAKAEEGPSEPAAGPFLCKVSTNVPNNFINQRILLQDTCNNTYEQ